MAACCLVAVQHNLLGLVGVGGTLVGATLVDGTT